MTNNGPEKGNSGSREDRAFISQGVHSSWLPLSLMWTRRRLPSHPGLPTRMRTLHNFYVQHSKDRANPKTLLTQRPTAPNRSFLHLLRKRDSQAFMNKNTLASIDPLYKSCWEPWRRKAQEMPIDSGRGSCTGQPVLLLSAIPAPPEPRAAGMTFLFAVRIWLIFLYLFSLYLWSTVHSELANL